MKAAYLKELGQKVIIDDQVALPELKIGQILVKLAYSSVCHSQLNEARGFRGKDAHLPHMFGHEGAGVVLDVGRGITKVKPGDKVVLTWIKGSGLEGGGAKYQSGELTINSGGVTTFMEQTIVSENRVVKIPDQFPLKLASLLGCAVPTGAGIVLNTLKPKPQSSIAIWGMGGIGMSALLGLRAFEPNVVIAIDVENSKLELAKKLGATHIINSKTQDALMFVREYSNGGVDYAIEASGRSDIIEQAFQSVRDKGGLCVFASHPPEGQKISIEPHDLIRGKRIKGSWGGDCNSDRDIPHFCDLYLQGRLPLEELLTHTYSLNEINDALDDLENRKVVRATIEIDSSLG